MSSTVQSLSMNAKISPWAISAPAVARYVDREGDDGAYMAAALPVGGGGGM